MTEFLSNTSNVFWLAIVLIACVPVVAEYWRRMRKDELDAGLKQDMIARGMSAEEIERVLAARSDRPEK
jgi:hypothetical protein